MRQVFNWNFAFVLKEVKFYAYRYNLYKQLYRGMEKICSAATIKLTHELAKPAIDETHNHIIITQFTKIWAKSETQYDQLNR